MGKPDVRHLRGGAGNVAYGGTVNPPRYRKGGAGNPPPTGARASALPDGRSPPYTADTASEGRARVEGRRPARVRIAGSANFAVRAHHGGRFLGPLVTAGAR